MSDEASAKLDAFCNAYGRLCLMGAQALHIGRTRDEVLKAMRGEPGWTMAPIRMQRTRCNNALHALKDSGSVDGVALVNRARAIKCAVEGEWDVTIPMATTTTGSE